MVGDTAPRSEGPSRMPDRTSPMTGGWRTRPAALPTTRPLAMTTSQASAAWNRESAKPPEPLLSCPLGLAQRQVEPQHPAAEQHQVDADEEGQDDVALPVVELQVGIDDLRQACQDQCPGDRAAPAHLHWRLLERARAIRVQHRQERRPGAAVR